MARLMRLHFASVGVSAARFAPLTLDFRSPEGLGRLGDGTVLWLRNGGGKSSILNLLFSIIIPSRRDFLGETADGRSQRFAAYIKERDLSFVVAEWYTGRSGQQDWTSETAQQHTWVTGQMLHWQSASSTHDDANLKRWFFAFRTGSGLELDSLPIQGLATPRLDNPKAFREWFDAQRREHPASECYATENQTDWKRVLIETLRLDPELFRLQLEMNRAEGGADRIMRFTTAAEFAQFIFRLASDPRQAEQLSDKLRELRTRQAQRPARLLEQRFLTTLEEPMRTVEQMAAQVAKDEELLAESAKRQGALLRAIEGRVDQCAAGEARAREEAAQADRDLHAHAQRAQQLDSAAAWHHRQGLLLALREADAALQAATRDLDIATRAVKAAEAARLFMALQKTTTELQARRDARRQAQLEREPQRRILCAAAVALRASLSVALEQSGRGLAANQSRLELNAAGLQETGEARKTNEARRLQVERAIAGCDSAIAARDRAWQGLVRERLLGDYEEPASARKRLNDELSAKHQEMDGTSARLRLIEQARQDHERQLREVELRQREVVTRFGNEQPRLAQALKRCSDLGRHPLLRDLLDQHEGVLSPGLLAQVGLAVQQQEAGLRRLAIEGHEDRRAEEHWQRTGLLPPSHDVELALEWLKKAGVPARSAGEYLGAQGLDKETIQGLLESDPARFGGIVVMTRDLLDGIDRLGDQPPLSQPVVVALPTIDAAPGAHDRRILASDGAAAASKEAAEEARRRILERIARIDEKERSAREQRDAWSNLSSELASLQREWKDGRLEELERTLAALEAERDSLAAERDRLQHQLEEHRRGEAENKAALDSLRTAVDRLQRHLERLDAFLRDHEAGMQARREERERLSADSMALASACDELEERLKRLRSEGEELRTEQRDLKARARDLDMERAALPQEYLEGDPPPIIPELIPARESYRQLKRQYEENPTIDRLNGEIDLLEKRSQEEHGKFERCAEGLDEQDWRRYTDDPFPDAAMAGLAERRDKANQAKAIAEQNESRARSALREDERRAGEIPPPLDGSKHARAVDCFAAEQEARHSAEKERDSIRRRTADAREARAREQSVAADRKRLSSILKRLQRPPDSGDTEQPVQQNLPEQVEEIERLVDDAVELYNASERQLAAGRRNLDASVEGVRRLADDAQFADLRDSLRSWMRVDHEEFVSGIARKNKDIEARIKALCVELETMEADRRLVLQELEQFARDCRALLLKVEKVSEIPAGLGEWSGQRFIEARLPQASVTPEERQARLLPLLEDLVTASSDLPKPEILAVRVIEALLGGRRLDIHIIKPHAFGSVQRYPVGDLGSFSDGERLTASVLIYCTLARLRARNRGELGDHPEAGALILDNPIGKCSHQGLVELQQRMARQLGVQLIYTTGIEDLGAISSFTRVIRLTNNSRSRDTGDFHVRTEETRVHSAALSFRHEEPPT